MYMQADISLFCNITCSVRHKFFYVCSGVGIFFKITPAFSIGLAWHYLYTAATKTFILFANALELNCVSCTSSDWYDPYTMWCRFNAVNFLANIHKMTPHSSPIRVSYGVSYVDPAPDWYFASGPVIICVITYNIGPRYHTTWLYYSIDSWCITVEYITGHWTQCEMKKAKTLFRLWTHKRHHIPHLYGQAMGHLFWVLWRKDSVRYGECSV